MSQIKAPSKQDEIDILRRAIAALGSNSYAGPWLIEQMPFIEMQIRSDMPLPTIREAQAEANRIIDEATQFANLKRARADEEAAHIVEEARRTKNDLLIRFRSSLRQAGIID